jgi:peptidoglycan/xylan/chitin deacetylase (PgdA/CDA1 family)
MSNRGPEFFEAGRRPAPDAIGVAGLLLLTLIFVSIVTTTRSGSEAEVHREAPLPTTAGLAPEPVSEPTPVRPHATPQAPTAAPSATPFVPQPSPSAVASVSEPTRAPSASPTATMPPLASPTSQDLPAAVSAPPTPVPLPTPTGMYSRTLPVPILMYHYISTPPEGADIYRQDLSVTPEDFRSQMRYLVDNGFVTVTLTDLSLAIVDKLDLPPRPIIITMDDGYLDNYENAFPILTELGLTATFFIATGFVDRGDPNYMTWEMMAEMAAAGMEFQPHSRSHSDLRERDRGFLISEIRGSREAIEGHLGGEARYFAYPAGRYDQAVIDILRELDFWGAVTTRHGRWHGFNDRFEWSRVRIRNDTTLIEFAEVIAVAGQAPGG